MDEKGIVTRDDSQRPQEYRAAGPESRMPQRLVSHVLRRVFGGSARKLVAALTAADIPEQELARIKKLLAEPKEPQR